MLDLAEEMKYAEIRKQCSDLNIILPPDIYLNFKVEKNNAIIFDDTQRGHSWNRNFYNGLFSYCAAAKSTGTNNFGSGYMTVKRNSGTVYYGTTGFCGYYGTQYSGSSGIYTSTSDYHTIGIIVGTSTTAFTSDDFKLNVHIASGNTSGTLFYQPMNAPNTPIYNAGTKIWTSTLSRVFNNNSGGTIVIGEVGLVANFTPFAASAVNILVERSVLSPTVSVLDGAQLTVTYTFSSDFSAID